MTYAPFQTNELKRAYAEARYLTRKKRIELSLMLSLSERQVKIWFQNQRMKTKKEENAKKVDESKTSSEPESTTGSTYRHGQSSQNWPSQESKQEIGPTSNIVKQEIGPAIWPLKVEKTDGLGQPSMWPPKFAETLPDMSQLSISPWQRLQSFPHQHPAGYFQFGPTWTP